MIFLLIVTLTSLLLAAIMSAVAWRLAGDERRRSDARVAALSAEIHEPDLRVGGESFRTAVDVGRVLSDPPAEPGPNGPGLESERTRPTVVDPEPTYSTSVRRARSRGRERGRSPRSSSEHSSSVRSARWPWFSLGHSRALRASLPPAAAPLPLELVALGHERVGDQLTVHGVVRNPSTGTGFDRADGRRLRRRARRRVSRHRPVGRRGPRASAWPRGDVRGDGAGSRRRRPVSRELQNRRPARAASGSQT